MAVLDSRLFNVIQLGLAFFFTFTAFQGCSVIQQTVFDTVHNRTGNVDAQAGYYGLAIMYGTFTIFNFIAAALANAITSKWTIAIGASCYTIFLGSFLNLSNAFFYSTSALSGLGSAMIWVGQGEYLTRNSDENTMGRNSAIVWAMYQFCLPVSGIFLYTQFEHGDELSDQTINMVYIVFTCLAGCGALIFALLRQPPAMDNSKAPDQLGSAGPHRNQLQTFFISFVRTFKLLRTLPMLMMVIVFIYTGLEVTFFSGVYGTCLSRTNAFGSASKILLAISTIFIGIGEILGGSLFSIFGTKIDKRFGRASVVILGMICHLSAFILIFINLPPESPMHETNGLSYIGPNEYLAIFCGFLLGFADSCWAMQVVSLLGSFYPENSAQAFGLYYFFKCGAASGAFFYSGYLLLHWQLLILAVICISGALAYFRVDHMGPRN